MEVSPGIWCALDMPVLLAVNMLVEERGNFMFPLLHGFQGLTHPPAFVCKDGVPELSKRCLNQRVNQTPLYRLGLLYEFLCCRAWFTKDESGTMLNMVYAHLSQSTQGDNMRMSKLNARLV